MVGGLDGLLVVLDDDDGIAEVAQLDQGIDQLAVVALVQSDRRFIEHVEDAHQLRADLRRQTDALSFTAGERGRAAVEHQIADADRAEKTEPVADLFENLSGDLLFARSEGDGLEKALRILELQCHDLVDRAIGHGDGKRLRFEPPAFAVGAVHRRHEPLDLFADIVVVRFLVAAREHRHHAFVRAVVGVRAFGAAELEFDLLGRAVKDDVAGLLGQGVPRRVDLELVVFGQRVDLTEPPVLGPFLPDGDGTVLDRLRPIRDDLLLVYFQ